MEITRKWIVNNLYDVLWKYRIGLEGSSVWVWYEVEGGHWESIGYTDYTLVGALEKLLKEMERRKWL
jgi:hypothetical protein